MFHVNVTSQVVLVAGGKVLFEEKDVELKSENILIVGGGILQVNATITDFQNEMTCEYNKADNDL